MSSVKKNYLYNIIGELLSIIVPVILLPYTSRVLGVDNIGIYSYMLSIVNVFSVFGRLGINTYGKIQIAQSRDDKKKQSKIFWELVTIRLFITTVTLLVYITFIFNYKKYVQIGLILAIYLISDALDIAWFFQGIENFKLIAIRVLIIRAFNLILVLTMVNGNDCLNIYAIIMQSTILIGNFSLWINLKSYVCRPTEINVFNIQHFRNCCVYFIPTIANLIYNLLDKVMLGLIADSTYQSGCYEQSYRLITVVQTFLLTIASTTLPKLTYLFKSKKHKEFNELISNTMEVLNIFLLPISIGLLINAESIVYVVLGNGYDGSVLVLQILSILLIFATYNYNIGNEILISMEKQKEYNKGVVTGAIVNFICNYFLISKFAAFGAAISSLMAEIIIFIIFTFYTIKNKLIHTVFNKRLIIYVGGTALMAFFNIILSKVISFNNPYLYLAIVIPVCALSYFMVLKYNGINIIAMALKKKK